MKKLCTVICLIACLTNFAQNKSSGSKTQLVINADIEKVAQDYYDHFDNIRGEKISETQNMIEYASMINPPGAIESTVMQIKSLENSYSWQALMLDTESYNAAVAKYKELYQQLNNTKLSLGVGKTYKLKGVYDAPAEAKSFASTLLGLDASPDTLRQFKVEIAMTYAMPDWSVKIYVYEKEDDVDIRPTANSDY